ncbi:uncharacterized protein LOC126739760 [Anthonomus grandis grandis]|uniref:uncharacterized protein LOC126739760 n=1 Tax=Anthonomus grandis grandis TaxID=2921223 RepID=UPI002166450E|nr:uncharacterized protein LOC126739760 [Anthonomus grandis grandis]
MSGKEGGVQAILRKKYKKALFFHCSSHKLNLVINDPNALPEIRNTVGAIKDIITFFRESVLRRKLIPNIPKLCETRLSEKYKSIRGFKENFCDIMEALETLSRDGNIATRKHAYQLHVAASKVSFIFSLGLIAKYSALLEPTVNVLQSVPLDAVQASQHISRILKLIKNHHASVIAEKIGLDMKSIPRTAERQQHRSNHPSKSPSEFWRRSITIPYLDSIINSLEIRFSEENRPSFTLLKLHPAQMKNISLEELEEACEEFKNVYGVTNMHNEIELWKNICEEKPESVKMSVVDILKETDDFFPEIKKALQILVALPCTTCTVERSFSSLRRIKTWLRSTMSETRLNGLAVMSVHRQHIFKNLDDFVNKVQRTLEDYVSLIFM